MLKHLVAVAGLLVATIAHAADGDGCASAATDYDSLGRGRMVPIWCVVLCDNKTTDADCTAFGFNTVGGIPDTLAFELHEVDINAAGGTDCTAGTFTLATSSDAGLTTASENVFPVEATTVLAKGATLKIAVDARTVPPGRYIMATSSAVDANCTDDGFDVLLIGYEEREP